MLPKRTVSSRTLLYTKAESDPPEKLVEFKTIEQTSARLQSFQLALQKVPVTPYASLGRFCWIIGVFF
jgi:hypothetical protein